MFPELSGSSYCSHIFSIRLRLLWERGSIRLAMKAFTDMVPSKLSTSPSAIPNLVATYKSWTRVTSSVAAPWLVAPAAEDYVSPVSTLNTTEPRTTGRATLHFWKMLRSDWTPVPLHVLIYFLNAAFIYSDAWGCSCCTGADASTIILTYISLFY